MLLKTSIRDSFCRHWTNNYAMVSVQTAMGAVCFVTEAWGQRMPVSHSTAPLAGKEHNTKLEVACYKHPYAMHLPRH